MRSQKIPDDIKIIAQFLADRAETGQDWQALTRSAFKLRRELKERGGYRLEKVERPAKQASKGNGQAHPAGPAIFAEVEAH